MNITHVLRAEEHLPNTLRQVGIAIPVSSDSILKPLWCLCPARCPAPRLQTTGSFLNSRKSSSRGHSVISPLASHHQLPVPGTPVRLPLISALLPQALIYSALGFEVPLFGHVSLILAADHSKLSKRHGATSVGDFQKQGYLPDAMVNFLALLGWNDGSEKEIFTREELIQAFSLDRSALLPEGDAEAMCVCPNIPPNHS